VPARDSQGLRIGAAAALAVAGFASAFALARMTSDDGAAKTPTEAGQASVAVLTAAPARLVRLAPGGAVPTLRRPPTTAAVVIQTAPVRTVAPATQPAQQPARTQAPAPEPEPTPAPQPTTYIP
jgi:hypothetical protein